jgi:hypothetical protein
VSLIYICKGNFNDLIHFDVLKINSFDFFLTSKASKGREAALIPHGYIPVYKQDSEKYRNYKAVLNISTKGPKETREKQYSPWSPPMQKLDRRPSSLPPGTLPLGLR